MEGLVDLRECYDNKGETTRSWMKSACSTCWADSDGDKDTFFQCMQCEQIMSHNGITEYTGTSRFGIPYTAMLDHENANKERWVVQMTNAELGRCKTKCPKGSAFHAYGDTSWGEFSNPCAKCVANSDMSGVANYSVAAGQMECTRSTCPAGTFHSSGPDEPQQCTPCPEGTFQDEIGMTKCKKNIQCHSAAPCCEGKTDSKAICPPGQASLQCVLYSRLLGMVNCCRLLTTITANFHMQTIALRMTQASSSTLGTASSGGPPTILGMAPNTNAAVRTNTLMAKDA